MSPEGTTSRDAQAGEADAPGGERTAEQRAEEIVEFASEQVARFARRLVARAREEVEDIVAEAQAVRRGDRPRE
jgi:hypothetical protein